MSDQEKFMGDNPDDDSLPEDPGKSLMQMLCKELLRRLSSPETASGMVASELEVVRKLLQDNSITLAHVRRGDFGNLAKSVAEDLPFDDEGNKVVSIR